MAGLKITTNLDPDKAHVIARRIAEEQGFTTEATQGKLDFTARKGSKTLAFLFHALAPFCDFRMLIEPKAEGTELRIDRNTPWWTGMIGAKRVKSRAEDLMNKIAQALRGAGGTVTQEA